MADRTNSSSQEQAQDEKLYTVNEAAAELGITHGAISAALSGNRLPFVRVKERRMIRHSDLEAYRARTQIGGAPRDGRPKGSVKADHAAPPADKDVLEATIVARLRQMDAVQLTSLLEHIEQTIE